MPTVALDAVANLGTANTTAGLSGAFTLASSATALCVAVGGVRGVQGFSWPTTHTVTVGGTPLTLLKALNCNNAAGNGWVELWGLIGPPTGSQTITVIENRAAAAASINVTAISYTGVAQFGTAVPNFGTAATASSGAVVSATGNRVLSVIGGLGATLTAPSGTLRSNQPATADAAYVTLMLQDSAGAATVTQTGHFVGSSGWGEIGVNLIAGNLWRVSAPLSTTVGFSAGGSFVGRALTIGAAHLSLTTTAAATGVDQQQGPPLRYVGRLPDSASVIGTTTYAQAQDVANLVTPAWISQQVTQSARNLVTSAWIAQQTSGYLTQAGVTTELASSYVPSTELGAANGIAQANGGGIVPSGQLPTLITNNVARVYDCVTDGTISLTSGHVYTATTENIGEFVMASVTIPNPGYPWIALPFAYVLGYSSGAASGNRLVGNGNYGFLAVTAAGQQTPLYGMALMTDDTIANYYPLIPTSLVQTTPLNQPPFETGVTLQLSVCNYTGSTYTVSGTGLVFYVLVLPALGG